MMPLALLAASVAAATTGVAAGWVGVGYAVHWATTSAPERPPLARYLAAFGPELWSTLRTWFGYPRGLPPLGPFAPYVTNGGPPIALLHGYMMNRSSMAWLAKGLKRRGYANVVSLEARPHRAPLEPQAQALARDLRRLSAHANGAKVIVIAHSQGGLLARIAVTREPDLPIAGIVTIGSPHAGTMLASVVRSPNGRQMRWGSQFLRDLPQPPVPLVSIYSDLDNIVFPKETSKLGRCIELPGLGHHALCFSPLVLDAVVAAFADFRFS